MKKHLKVLEEKNQEMFNKMMDSLFPLAESLHALEDSDEELTKEEADFLEAFDAYIDSACELNDLEESMNQ